MAQIQSITNQNTVPMPPIDTQQIVEHGESPTAIILAIAILSSTLISGITGLVRVILVTRSFR